MNCQECKSWLRCRPGSRDGWGVCCSIFDEKDFEANIGQVVMVVTDEEKYTGRLLTREDFGCVLFEAKP